MWNTQARLTSHRDYSARDRFSLLPVTSCQLIREVNYMTPLGQASSRVASYKHQHNLSRRQTYKHRQGDRMSLPLGSSLSTAW